MKTKTEKISLFYYKKTVYMKTQKSKMIRFDMNLFDFDMNKPKKLKNVMKI
jgi:hypothetical protein